MVPRLTDVLLDTAELRRLRQEVVAGARGTVVEIGFGSGLNLAWYPPAVHTVLAVEPSRVATQLAARRIDRAPMPVELVGLDGQAVTLDRASVDTAVSTFTLCTVPDPVEALGELFRVLRPGGALLFLEHGRSPVPATAAWQRRLTPVQRRIAGGCHLDRPIDRLVQRAGFAVSRLRNDQLSGPRALRPFGYLYLGVATKPAPAGHPRPARAAGPPHGSTA